MRKTKRKKLQTLQVVRSDIDVPPCTSDRTHDIWDVVCDTQEEAEDMRTRATLIYALIEEIANRRLSRLDAAALCGVSKQRIRLMERGRISQFSLADIKSMTAALMENARHQPLPK